MSNASGSRATGLAPARDAAFVIHLTDLVGEHGAQARGRVEHVTSGRVARFDSVDELLRFMRQTLDGLDRCGS
jgi:hypothetical protein